MSIRSSMENEGLESSLVVSPSDGTSDCDVKDTHLHDVNCSSCASEEEVETELFNRFFVPHANEQGRSKDGLFSRIQASHDKLFFVLYNVAGKQQSFLVQVDLKETMESEGIVENPTSYYCIFYLLHPDDTGKPATEGRYWIRWQKLYPQTGELSCDVTLYSPSQSKKARTRSCVPYADWIDLSDPAVFLHGPFDFQRDAKTKKSNYHIGQKDLQRLPGGMLSSTKLEESKMDQSKRLKVDVDKFYVGPSSRIYKMKKVTKSGKEYLAECHMYLQLPELEGMYARVQGRSVYIPLTQLEEADNSFHSRILPFTYHPPDAKDAFHFAYSNEQEVRLSTVPLFSEEKPKLLDLFSGAGGASLGFSLAGFQTNWAVEKDPCAAATFKASKHGAQTTIYLEDVCQFLVKGRKNEKGYPGKGEVDHLHASTPCQGFSLANRYGGEGDDSNNDLSSKFAEAVEVFEPKTASMENVMGMLRAQNVSHLHNTVSKLLLLGYQVRGAVLNARDYGDPQSRRRLILFAARKDCALPCCPTKTHGIGGRPFNTAGGALGFLEHLRPDFDGAGIAQLDDGFTICNHVSTSRTPTPEDTVLNKNEPAGTILASRPPLHYSEQRYITVREAACLQSFPRDYQFFGTREGMYRQVGNAVPVRLARAIARSIYASHER